MATATQFAADTDAFAAALGQQAEAKPKNALRFEDALGGALMVVLGAYSLVFFGNLLLVY